MHITQNKQSRLFLILGGFFVTNALIAEFVGVKIFSLEKSLGFEPVNINLLTETNLSFQLTVGIILWPVVFVMTDIINEYFGKRGVKFLSYLTVGLISYAFLMVCLGINLVPADWWKATGENAGVPDMQAAFSAIFGQGLWIIVGSMVAFLVGQLVDVFVFQKLKKMTGDGKIWLRATGSTLVSQFIDSYVVLFIAFYIGAGWSLSTVIAIGTVGYIYKFAVAVLLTPVIYLAHYLIDGYLGKELAEEMKAKASQ